MFFAGETSLLSGEEVTVEGLPLFVAFFMPEKMLTLLPLEVLEGVPVAELKLNRLLLFPDAGACGCLDVMELSLLISAAFGVDDPNPVKDLALTFARVDPVFLLFAFSKEGFVGWDMPLNN